MYVLRLTVFTALGFNMTISKYLSCSSRAYKYCEVAHTGIVLSDRAGLCTCMISYRDKANPSNDARRQLFFSQEKKKSCLGRDSNPQRTSQCL